MTIRIVLADDHEMIRDGLRALIAVQDNMTVVGEAADGQSALKIAEQLSPSVVILDVGMPELNGIDAARQITKLKCRPKVIGLSMHADQRYVTQMLKAGASGYVLKDSAFEELVHAINTVVKGQAYLSPQIAGAVVTELKRSDEEKDGSVFSILTTREREVLQKIAEGFSTKEIASSLSISGKTIETHRHKLMEKLNLHGVAQLTKYALKEGLTSLDK